MRWSRSYLLLWRHKNLEKYQPTRRCAACRKTGPKNELFRIVLADEDLKVDIDQRTSGRGCYVCKSEECIKIAAEKGGFSRSFKKGFPKARVEEIRNELLSLLNNY